jgi:hypothetical protein
MATRDVDALDALPDVAISEQDKKYLVRCSSAPSLLSCRSAERRPGRRRGRLKHARA